MNRSTKTNENQISLYYELLDKIEQAKKQNDMAGVLNFSLKSLYIIGALIKNTKQHFGSFDITSIPALEEGPMVALALEDKKSIEDFIMIVSQYQELEPWKKNLMRFEKLAKVVAFIRENSGYLQKNLKKMFPDVDPYLISQCAIYLESCGRIKRERAGNSLMLIWIDK